MANLYFDEALARTFAGELLTVSGDEGRHAVTREPASGSASRRSLATGRPARAWHGGSGRRERLHRARRTQRGAGAPERRIVLVQALAKGDRDERAVEQATEFGVDAIIPWQAERSVSRWGNDKASKGVAKWARIAREASKQSMRAWIPEVLSPATTAELAALDGHVLVLHPRGATKLSAWLPDDGRDVYLVVGPEGGLSDAELAALAGQTDGEPQRATGGSCSLETTCCEHRLPALQRSQC